MTIFVKLLLAHLLGDFILQPTTWVLDKENKKHRSTYLYLHVFLHFILVSALVGKANFIGFAIVLALTHGGIDFLKLHYQKKKTKRIWFVVDQLMHLLILLVIALLYNHECIDFAQLDNRFWIFITGIVLLTKPTSIIIKIIISVWTPENKKSDDSLSNAGNYIGILERLFVFCFIITNHFEAIGFLLAAKSIFRFGDLKEAKDRKLTEYVLIGTLLSFGIALLTGLLVQSGLLNFL